MQIKNFKELNKGVKVAQFDIHFEKMGMTIRECALMRSGSREWVNLPSRKYVDHETQETRYYCLVVFSPEKRDAFQNKCRELLEPFLTLSPTPSNSEDLPF